MVAPRNERGDIVLGQWSQVDARRGRLSHECGHELIERMAACHGRLRRLEDAVQRLLEVASVIGQDVPLDLWAGVSGADEESLLAAVEQATEAHLVMASRDGARVQFATCPHPRGAVRGRPADAAAGVAPAQRRNAGGDAESRPGRGGAPLPGGGRYARVRMAGTRGGSVRTICLRLHRGGGSTGGGARAACDKQRNRRRAGGALTSPRPATPLQRSPPGHCLSR